MIIVLHLNFAGSSSVNRFHTEGGGGGLGFLPPPEFSKLIYVFLIFSSLLVANFLPFQAPEITSEHLNFEGKKSGV